MPQEFTDDKSTISQQAISWGNVGIALSAKYKQICENKIIKETIKMVYLGRNQSLPGFCWIISH